MASRYPLVVNTAIPRLEELKGVDDLNLSQSKIQLSNGLPTSANQVISYDGTQTSWVPFDNILSASTLNGGVVFRTATQTLTNKTISGTTNTLTNIPNSALVNSSITIGGTQVFLGGSISALNTDTKYELGATGALNLVTLNLQAYDVNNNTLANPTPNGDTTVKVVGSGATSVAWNAGTSTLTISSTDNDTNTTYSALATGGLTLSGTAFSLKNSSSLSNNVIPRWNTTNSQLQNGSITDTGTAVTVSQATTISSTLTTTGNATVGSGAAAPVLAFRGGNNLIAGNATIQVVLTTNGIGTTLTDTRLFYDATTGSEGWRIDDQDNNLHYINHISSAAAPATATSTGRPGQVRFDAGFIYLCVAQNSWIRATRVAF